MGCTGISPTLACREQPGFRMIKLSVGSLSGFVFVRSAGKQIIFSDLALDVITIELANRAQLR